MAITSMIKSGCGGVGEYLSGTVTLDDTTEYLEFEFNDEVTVDEILVNVTGGSINDEYDLQIIYPASDQVATVATFSASSAPTPSTPLQYFLNSTEGTGHSGTGKLWFYIPPRGRLRLFASSLTGTDRTVNMVALGRGGV